jgi:spore coat protein U-like protein
MKIKSLFSLILGVGLISAGAQADAGTASTTFQVSATVNNSCAVSANALSFGTYNPLSTLGLTLSGGVIVTCTVGTPFNIGLNQGTATGATVTTRQMASGSNLLSYALYRDTLHTLNWGQTVGTDTLAGTGTGLAITYPVYGSLPASQSVPTGTYSDTITVTVSY